LDDSAVGTDRSMKKEGDLLGGPIRSMRTSGKVAILLSLVTAGAGFFLYYTIPQLDAPLFAFSRFRLADFWTLSGLLLLAGVCELLLCGPLRKGDLFSFAHFFGSAVWGLGVIVGLLWLGSNLTSPHWPTLWTFSRPTVSLVVASVLAALAFDFGASPWIRHHRNRLVNLAVMFVSVGVAGGLAEFVMRYVFRPPVFSPLYTRSSIPGCGFEMRPSFDGPCGNVHVRLNSDGFRSSEISPQKTRKRILAIGDSVTFGAWVEQDKTFPAALQKLLPADRYEVINAGIPAYDLEQVIALFEGKGARCQPDIVVYTFVYDDIADPLALGDGGVLLQEKGKRYGGSVTMPDRFRFFPMPRGLVQRSRLLTATMMRYYRFREGRYVGSGDRDLFADLLTERWGWLEERLIGLRGAVEKAGAKFLLVIFPVGLSGQSIERLMTIARMNGIEALELRTVLGDAKNYAAKYMTPWDAHPNADAHALMARAIADRLIKAGFVESAISKEPSWRFAPPGKK